MNLDEQPVIIGHSFGGLVTQVLIDKGYGWLVLDLMLQHLKVFIN